MLRFPIPKINRRCAPAKDASHRLQFSSQRFFGCQNFYADETALMKMTDKMLQIK